MTAATLALLAPIGGWLGPLTEVPDPVFAERMLGDGVAIDPTGSTLHAPCAGTVGSLHGAGHAVSLRAENGAEILMHIGLETVALGGEGFVAHVAGGQRVAAGDPLITFDIDLLARRARSLQTAVIVTNGEAFAISSRQGPGPCEPGSVIMEIAPLARDDSSPPAFAETASRRVVVALAHGLHARPAARVSERARTFAGDLTLDADGRRANAKSPLAIMMLGLARGAAVTITASGAGAARAVADLARLIDHDLASHEDDRNRGAHPTAGRPEAEAAGRHSPPAAGLIHGVRANGGLAIGVAVRRVRPRLALPTAIGEPAVEARALTDAIEVVASRLRSRGGAGRAPRAAIATAHLALLTDPDLEASARDDIARGAGAATAFRRAIEARATALRAVGDPLIAERADDLLDLEQQVLGAITGEASAIQAIPDGAVLLADDLSPSELMALEGAPLAGICTARGGPTSHMAILAAARNLPTLVGAGEAVTTIPDGTPLILDGDAGTLTVAPGAAAIAAAEARLAEAMARRHAAQAMSGQDCVTADGRRIAVFANLGSLDDARAAREAGAEGCGLLRTEFLFMDRETAPGEDEQLAVYQAIATALAGRPLIIRTFDIGADKPATYLDLAPEENPALGLRGVRLGLARPDLLRSQLRAILRIAAPGERRIMVPMIASVSELAAVRALLEEAADALGLPATIPLGAMVETPAAAVTADLLAAQADFFSIGANDLAQYALAMDRGHPGLAAEADGLHPAVLRLIDAAVRGAKIAGRPVGVCGGLASDLAAAPILIGLGVTELSATPARVPELAALIRTLSIDGCADLARRALAQPSAAAVRTLALPGVAP
jgi:phosphocarrier protein FPr/phosphocarrier protein